MIIDYGLTNEDYQSCVIDNYKQWHFDCPDCKKMMKFHRHGTYQRYLSLIKEETVSIELVEILRLKCTGCGATHAILTPDMIPYRIYSMSLFMWLLDRMFCEEKSLLRISDMTGISYQGLQIILKLFVHSLEKICSLISYVEYDLSHLADTSRKIISAWYENPPPYIQKKYMEAYIEVLFQNRKSTTVYKLRFIVA